MANAMTQAMNDVTAKDTAIESRAVFTNCSGHSLNLACADTLKQSKVIQEALDIIKSPQQYATFKEEMASDSPGI